MNKFFSCTGKCLFYSRSNFFLRCATVVKKDTRVCNWFLLCSSHVLFVIIIMIITRCISLLGNIIMAFVFKLSMVSPKVFLWSESFFIILYNSFRLSTKMRLSSAYRVLFYDSIHFDHLLSNWVSLNVYIIRHSVLNAYFSRLLSIQPG